VSERICIVGCGAIGGLYAAHLATLPEVEVWAYDVSQPHVDAINHHGLRLVGHTELVANVRARTDPHQIPECGFGIVATKGIFTAAAIAATAHVFRDAAVCSVQNGIGNEEVIAEYVPRVMRGVTLPAGRLASPGVIHMDAPGTTWIGPFEPRPATMPEVERLASLLTSAGMETRGLEDVRGAQWTKLLFNSSTNPLCALTGLTHGQLCEHPPTRRLVSALIREGRAVAEALGISLDGDPGALVDEAARVNYYHRPSMLQDVLARRPTEIATLNGGIVRAARQPGLPTPLNEAIVDLISGLEHSWSVRSISEAELRHNGTLR
jgi:2-dehydropantoate 2-reductase